MKTACSLTLLLVALAVGCGPTSLEDVDTAPETSDDDGNAPRTAPGPDAGPDCEGTLVPDHNVLTQDEDGLTFYSGADVRRWYISQAMSEEAEWTVGYMVVNLFQYKGSFFDGIGIGSYSIDGDDRRYNSCALCAFVSISKYDVDPIESYVYMAESGRLTVTEVDEIGDVIHGSLTDLVLTPHKLDAIGNVCEDDHQCGGASLCNRDVGRCIVATPVPDLCPATVGRFDF